jgi:hypothetical protein
MPKSPGDELGAREQWIEERLGERKYRQLRMHLNGALRLLNELAATDGAESKTAAEQPSDHHAKATKAVADLTQRLQELAPKRPIRIRNLKPVKRERRKAT